jgi:hypothetical protein
LVGAAPIESLDSHLLPGETQAEKAPRSLSTIEAIILASRILTIIVLFFLLTMGTLLILKKYGKPGIIATCAVIGMALVFVMLVYLLVQKIAFPSSQS